MLKEQQTIIIILGIVIILLVILLLVLIPLLLSMRKRQDETSDAIESILKSIQQFNETTIEMQNLISYNFKEIAGKAINIDTGQASIADMLRNVITGLSSFGEKITEVPYKEVEDIEGKITHVDFEKKAAFDDVSENRNPTYTGVKNLSDYEKGRSLHTDDKGDINDGDKSNTAPKKHSTRRRSGNTGKSI